MGKETIPTTNIHWETDPIVHLDPTTGEPTETEFKAKNWETLSLNINRKHMINIQVPEGKYTRDKLNYLVFHYQLGKKHYSTGAVTALDADEIATFKSNPWFGYNQVQFQSKDSKDPVETIDHPGYAIDMLHCLKSDAGIEHQFPGTWMPDWLAPDGEVNDSEEKYKKPMGIIKRRGYMGAVSYSATNAQKSGVYFYLPLPFGYFETGKAQNFNMIKMLFTRNHPNNDIYFPNRKGLSQPAGPDLFLYTPHLALKSLSYKMKYFNPGKILRELTMARTEVDNHYYSTTVFREDFDLGKADFDLIFDEVPDKPVLLMWTLVPKNFEDNYNISELPKQCFPEPKLPFSSAIYTGGKTRIYTETCPSEAGFAAGDVIVIENGPTVDGLHQYPMIISDIEMTIEEVITDDGDNMPTDRGSTLISVDGDPLSINGKSIPTTPYPQGWVTIRKSSRNYLERYNTIVEPGNQKLQKKVYKCPGIELDVLKRRTRCAYENFLNAAGNIFRNFKAGSHLDYDEFMDKQTIFCDNLTNVTSLNTPWDKKPADKWKIQVNGRFTNTLELRFPVEFLVVVLHEKSVIFTGKGQNQNAITY